MAICERCGRGGMRTIHGAIKFKDGKCICIKCLKELGREHPYKDAFYLQLKTSEEILRPEISQAKKWDEDCARRAARLYISTDQYKMLYNGNATEFEFKLFSRICQILDDEGCDSSVLTLGENGSGSLFVLKGDKMILEYKGEPDIKWLRLADAPDSKIRFGQLSKLNSLADRIVTIYRSL